MCWNCLVGSGWEYYEPPLQQATKSGATRTWTGTLQAAASQEQSCSTFNNNTRSSCQMQPSKHSTNDCPKTSASAVTSSWATWSHVKGQWIYLEAAGSARASAERAGKREPWIQDSNTSMTLFASSISVRGNNQHP